MLMVKKDIPVPMRVKLSLQINKLATKPEEVYNCTDGCKISTDGTAIKLMNGYALDKDDKVAMIPHDQTGHVCSKDCPMAKQI